MRTMSATTRFPGVPPRRALSTRERERRERTSVAEESGDDFFDDSDCEMK
jgi:hypothetical protein